MRSLKNKLFNQIICKKKIELLYNLKKFLSSGFPDNFDNFYQEDYVDSEAIAGRVLYAYTRFLIKKFSISDLDQYSAPLCPYFDKYKIHLSGLVKKAITKNRKDRRLKKVFWPSSGCKEIDILMQRYLKREYKITVGYSNFNFKYIYSKGYHCRPNRIGLKDLFLSLLILFKPSQRDTKKKIESQIIFKKPRAKSIILLAHQNTENIPAYGHLSDELKTFFYDKEINIIKLLPNSIGINNFQRIKAFYLALLLWINFIKKGHALKFRDLDFLFFYFSSKEYKKNLISIMNRIRTTFIISVYIDRVNEPNFVRAAREIGIKYFHYDYSMGYPYGKPHLLRYLLDSRRYADVIFANSTYRLNQYKYSTLHLDHPPKLSLHLCPQIDYSIRKSVKQIMNKRITKRYTIALIDNYSKTDLYIQQKDIDSLLKVLNIFKKKFDFIVQSKRGSLIKTMKELYFNISKMGTQGDFSNIINADIVISLNLQGAALKACFAFDKPMLIFTKDQITSLNSRFSLDDDENKLINNSINNVRVNEKQLIKTLKNILINKNYSNYYLKNTRNLIDLINIENSKNLSYYFTKYLK